MSDEARTAREAEQLIKRLQTPPPPPWDAPPEEPPPSAYERIQELAADIRGEHDATLESRDQLGRAVWQNPRRHPE